jgi:hypothetical protein
MSRTYRRLQIARSKTGRNNTKRIKHIVKSGESDDESMLRKRLVIDYGDGMDEQEHQRVSLNKNVNMRGEQSMLTACRAVSGMIFW